jgi:hypothetical protein
MAGHSTDNGANAKGAKESSRNFSMTRWGTLLVGVLVVVVLVVVFYPRKSHFPPLPQPNGYDMLTQAASKILRSQTSVKDMTTSEVAALVAKNRSALDELRRALALPSAVPVQMNQAWMQTHFMNLKNLKAAATAMDSEAFFLRQQGNLTGALDESLDMMRFGKAIARQGLLIDFLVGGACEMMASSRMTNLLTTLNAADCHRAALALEQQDARRESLEDITRRDREWTRKTYGPSALILDVLAQLSFEPDKRLSANTAKKYRTIVLRSRLLMLNLAGRAFELERGRKPTRASELVPDYLHAIPVDPESGSALEWNRREPKERKRTE